MTTHKETIITARELSYTAIFEPAEEGGYVVFFPAIPNLMTQGETLTEAKEMALECLQCYLESLQEDNLPIPEERYASEAVLERLRVTVPRV
jgi:antitoxin HicB